MKILFVLEHFYPYIGGSEKLFFELSKKLTEKGYQVTVVTTRYKPSLPKEEMIDKVQVFRMRSRNRFLFSFFSLPAIIAQARHADLIHTTTYNAALPACLAGWFLRKPVIVTFHEVWGKLWLELPFLKPWQKRLYFAYEKMVLWLPFHRYLAVSKFTKERLKDAGIKSSRIVQIYNGLDYENFKPLNHIPPPVFTYTYFGRLGVSKGLDILLPAAKRFREHSPKSRLQLIIPKQPKAIYQLVLHLIQSLNLEEHVVLLHDLPRQQLYGTLLQSSCVVIPSYSEGFCFAAAEAAALGVPIISSGKGALKEVVSGKNIQMQGLTENALLEALLSACSGDWKVLPEKRFTLKQTVEQHLELYATLQKENGKR